YEAWVVTGGRVFISMARSPELYFSLLGALKVGAIVGPLFEAFMEKAVRDRLENSDAKVIITTPELLPRIPMDDLPNLEKVVVVGDGVEGDYLDFDKSFENASDEFDIEWLDKEDGMI